MPKERMEALHHPPITPPQPLPIPWLYASLPCGCSCVVAFIINQEMQVKCFPEFVSDSSKLSNTMKGFWESTIYSQLFRSTGGNLGLKLASEVGAVLWN